MDGFVKGADFGPQQILFKSNTDTSDDHTAEMKLYSMYSNESNHMFIPAHLMESVGTLKMIDFALIFVNFFPSGCVFLMDEFDASLHPEIIKGILALFNAPEFNKNGSQLIFTTHNPIMVLSLWFPQENLHLILPIASNLYCLLNLLFNQSGENFFEILALEIKFRNDLVIYVSYFVVMAHAKSVKVR